ncbi:helix-turn-helix transcriptional regulator [Shewanella donghaensis]|uniref:helix-turn-helix transcriptional regulator n=1 Tax=Shewanella donghaensis TaxID=238836 RepID=UPI001183AFAF|nr:helix-turn-helix domain-containing protein [Shewanella donghaensis]
MAQKHIDHLEMYIDENRLIKRQKILELLDISSSTLRRWIKSGKFPPPIENQDAHLKWQFKDVHEWLTNR